MMSILPADKVDFHAQTLVADLIISSDSVHPILGMDPCPNSIAIDGKSGSAVILDGEMKSQVLSNSNEASFLKWFGSPGAARYAKQKDASLLHSRALLLFFREALGYLSNTDAPVAKQLGAQLDQLSKTNSLDELENQGKKFAEDWSVRGDEMVTAATIAPPVARPAIRQQKKQSWLGWFVGSFLANIFLAVLVLLLGGMFLFSDNMAVPKKPGAMPVTIDEGKKDSPQLLEDSSLQFSSYCVVFPARGTSSEKVLTSLKQLYPDSILVPMPGELERERLLNSRLDLAMKSLPDPNKIQRLLAQLNTAHSIRFNGFSTDAEDVGLRSIIANGGLYKIVSPSEQMQHGSLLRANAVDRILNAAGMEKEPEARALLESLKTGTHEYASIKDAVTIIGNRIAFILQVEPTAKAHEAVRKQLLARDGAPVFIPRPVFELFDAVDPAAGSGGGVAKYSLKLDTKCTWRLVSAEDRKQTDFKNNETNENMRWRPFEANQEIVWTTLPVLRQNGRTDNVSSFDIAVPVNANKVVIFRNQSILSGESREKVLNQARGYLNRVLGLKSVQLDDAVSVRQQEERFTGALVYNYLAEQAAEAREDLEIMTLTNFEQTRDKEDGVLIKSGS